MLLFRRVLSARHAEIGVDWYSGSSGGRSGPPAGEERRRGDARARGHGEVTSSSQFLQRAAKIFRQAQFFRQHRKNCFIRKRRGVHWHFDGYANSLFTASERNVHFSRWTGRYDSGIHTGFAVDATHGNEANGMLGLPRHGHNNFD